MTRHFLPSVLAIVSLAPVWSPHPAAAEPPMVPVSGTVRDTSGGVLPGARIEALVAGLTVATTTAGADGQYTIQVQATTEHQLRAHLSGFADQVIGLRTAQAATRDFVLHVAGIADTVIVTPGRMRERTATATESVDVFTSRDIAALGSASLADLVRMVPGLSADANGREGALTSVFARGGESDYNLVLIDGVRVNQSGGAFDFSRVSGAEMDRVEVVRGAQSALYGSDAIGSVVQVITRRAAPGDPPEVTASIERGSFNTWRGDARVLGGVRRRMDYQAGVTRRATAGAFQDLLPEHDRFDETTVDVGVGAILGDEATLRTGVRYATAHGKAVGPIDYGSRNTGTIADSTDLSWHVDLTDRPSPRVNQQAMFAYYRSGRQSGDTVEDPTYDVSAILAGTPGARFPNGPRLVRLLDEPTFAAYRAGSLALQPGEFLATTPYGESDFLYTNETRFERAAFKYQADLSWSGGQVTSGGYDYERETDPLDDGFLIENHALFVQHRLVAGDRFFATAGVRLDHNSRYGDNASPKLGAGGFVVPYSRGRLSSAKLFANIGRGIKNPTFGELYGSAFTDGNPALRPERARTVDAGVEATFADQRVLARVTYFDNVYNDQVAYQSSGPGVDGRPDFVNIDGSAAHGWEIEGALQRPMAGGLTASVGYGFVDSRVVSSVNTNEEFQPGQPLLRRPRHSATMRLAYSRGRTTVTVNWRHVGERHDAAFLGLEAVPSAQFPGGRAVDITVNPAYTLVRLGAEVRVSGRASVFVRVDNATDAAYEHALGYPGLPRAVTAGVRVGLARQ